MSKACHHAVAVLLGRYPLWRQISARCVSLCHLLPAERQEAGCQAGARGSIMDRRILKVRVRSRSSLSHLFCSRVLASSSLYC